MSDAAPAIKNAFKQEFPFAARLTCWFLVEESLRKRQFAIGRNRATVLKDVAKLRLSPNLKIFDVGASLFVTN